MATTTARPNTYAGTCADCHGHVAAKAGLLGAKVNGRWTVRHNDCTATTTTPTRRVTRTASSDRGFHGRRKSCLTGGNCSSFGSGRSCGAHDCDGY